MQKIVVFLSVWTIHTHAMEQISEMELKNPFMPVSVLEETVSFWDAYLNGSLSVCQIEQQEFLKFPHYNNRFLKQPITIPISMNGAAIELSKIQAFQDKEVIPSNISFINNIFQRLILSKSIDYPNSCSSLDSRIANKKKQLMQLIKGFCIDELIKSGDIFFEISNSEKQYIHKLFLNEMKELEELKLVVETHAKKNNKSEDKELNLLMEQLRRNENALRNSIKAGNMADIKKNIYLPRSIHTLIQTLDE